MPVLGSRSEAMNSMPQIQSEPIQWRQVWHCCYCVVAVIWTDIFINVSINHCNAQLRAGVGASYARWRHSEAKKWWQ